MNWLSVLKAVAPKGSASILQGVANAMPGMVAEFSLNTTLRQAHFLAQIAHESDGFKTTVEYASGAAYEGRKDLGNTQAGDGKRFKGRGLIQLTGRDNYAAASHDLGVDLIADPAAAAAFPTAIRAAGWYWQKHGLNAKADADNLTAVTKAINGGANGLDSRKQYLARAKAALAKPEALPEASPVTATTSKTNTAAIVAGAAGTIPAVKEAISTAQDVKDTADQAAGLVGSILHAPWLPYVLAAVVLGAVSLIIVERVKKMREHGI